MAVGDVVPAQLRRPRRLPAGGVTDEPRGGHTPAGEPASDQRTRAGI